MPNPPLLTPHPSPQPIGLLGGTFDPIHYGHLRLAEEMAEALGLEEVRILPTGTPPHRGQPHASPRQRLEMVRLAIAGNPRFVLDEHEVHKTGPCYMVDTLAVLRAELGSERPICLFLGADAFRGLTGWSRWRQLFDLAHLAVAHRPGYSAAGWEASLPPELAGEFHARVTTEPTPLRDNPAGRVYCHAITQLDISASRIRALIREGRSSRYLAPEGVLDYIAVHQLYR